MSEAIISTVLFSGIIAAFFLVYFLYLRVRTLTAIILTPVLLGLLFLASVAARVSFFEWKDVYHQTNVFGYYCEAYYTFTNIILLIHNILVLAGPTPRP